MTELQKQHLRIRLSKLATESERPILQHLFEENEILPGSFGVTLMERGYEYWIEDYGPKPWGIQVFISHNKIYNKELPLHHDHFLDVIAQIQEIRKLHQDNPDHNDTRVTYL